MRTFLKIILTVVLIALSVICFKHGSSAGFEIGTVFGFASLLHWGMWNNDSPKKEESKSGST